MGAIRRSELESVYGLLLTPYRASHAGPRTPRPWTRPLRRTAKAILAVARYGPGVVRHHSVGFGKQTRRLVQCLRDGFSVEDFYRYRLYRQPSDTLFVPSQFNYEIRSNLYRKLGIDPDLLADKRRFAKAAAEAQLPIAHTIADFSEGQVRWWAGNSLPTVDLFAKEAQAMCGQGAMSWRWNGSGWVDEESGATYDEARLLARLAQLSKQAPYIVQQRLSNHPELRDLSPVGLCTVRVVTVRSPSDDAPRILLCAFRIPKSGDIADNFARGGVACSIDVQTGVLGLAVLKDLHHAHLDLERHPDNGARITGRTLPCWDEVKALALRAHRCFPQFPSIGWDVAIADRGPLLLEANYNWDSVLAQQVGCCPLGATEWPGHLLAWINGSEGQPPTAEQARS